MTDERLELQVGILHSDPDKIAINFPHLQKRIFLDYESALTLGFELLKLAEAIKPPPKDAA